MGQRAFRSRLPTGAGVRGDGPALSDEADLARFRPNVGVVLIREDGKVWLGRRARSPGPRNWQFPQGGVDEGEAPLAAAVRELREETGVTSVRLIGQTTEWLAYRFPPEHRSAKAARGWRGQKQLWFAFRFLGADSEIDLEAHGDVEFDAWCWADIHQALETVVAFKAETYRQVIDAFRNLTLGDARGG